jgi:acyl-CoA synthetase (AMP-forming)/AMP-acid ligase II
MIRSIADHVRFQARLRPSALAVFGPAGPVSFERLRHDVEGLAGELVERQLTPDDMVGVHLGFSYLHLVMILALDRLDIPSMSFMVADAAPAPPLVLPHLRLTAIVSAAAAPTDPPCRWIAMPDQHRPSFAAPDPRRLAALAPPRDRLLRVTWTSGTTGAAKGSPMTRAVQELRLTSLRLVRGLGPRTRYFLGMPLSSGYAYAMALAVLVAGGAIVLPDPAADPISLANALAVTATGGSPAMLTDLLGRAGGPGRGFGTVQFFDVVGALLPAALAREARRGLTPNIWSTYGSTEGGWAATADSAVCIAEPGAVGYILPWIDVEIVDDAERPLPAGGEGRVRLRGPQVVMRYHDDEETAARIFRDGWFYPGDLGSIGADGLLRITGRVEEAIRRGATHISALPIEDAMRELPGVRDVAVFGLTGAAGADEVCAALVVARDADPEAIRAATAARLGAQAPARLFIVDHLPRNENGKVLRRELVALAQRSRATRTS